MIKKILTLFLCAMVLVSALAGCGSTGSSNSSNSGSGNDVVEDSPATVTVSTVYGEVEVPFNPDRVAILNGDAMDVMVTLGLADKVVSVRSTNEYPAYLADYYTSDSIVQLNLSTKNLPEGADPMEPYYAIDADLIIAHVQEIDQEKYDVISQIAPTVVLDYVSNNEAGMYTGVKENALTIAKIFGVEDKVTELTKSYDELYTKLEEACAGKTCVITKGKADMNTVQVQANDNSLEADGDEAIKDNERAGLLLNELGMKNLSNEAPEGVSMSATNAAVKAAGEDKEAVRAVAKDITNWIESVDPDYLWVIDKTYSSLDEVTAAGFEYSYVTDLSVYKDGGFHFLAKEWTLARGGLTGMFIMLDQLAEIMLG